jgi:hypothetical protein
MGKGVKRDAPIVQVSLGMDGVWMGTHGPWGYGFKNIALKLAMFQWVLCFGAHVVHASKPVPGCLKINNAVMTCR